MSPDVQAADELVDAVYLPFTPQELASREYVSRFSIDRFEPEDSPLAVTR